MNARNFSVGFAGALALSTLFAAGAAMAQATAPTSGPAANGSPAWFMQGSFSDPGGRTVVAADGTVSIAPAPAGGRRGGGAAALTPCNSDIAQFCGGQAGAGARACLTQNAAKLSGECKTAMAALPFAAGTPGCSHSTICGRRGGKERGQMQRVEWKQNLGYTFTYPIVLPAGTGGVPSVALDSKGNLWVFQRKPEGMPQLFKFDPNHKLILSVGDDVIGHQDKAHGMAVDADDNVWICDAGNATVTKLSPDGKVLMTIGVKGKRGDWDEAKGQRLLWQPVMLAFAKNGDIYIAEGHANESPNDVDSDDPANNIGAARIIHLDHNGKFINQWFGDEVNQGKFDSTHGFAIDPKNGDVWIGDREQYRIVVYTANGEFLKTLSMRNLVCAIEFDAQGNPWMGSGQDGQYLKLTRDGKVIGAVGLGMGIGKGQFIEASYFVFDKHNNIYAGDTSVGRVTVMLAPTRK